MLSFPITNPATGRTYSIYLTGDTGFEPPISVASAYVAKDWIGDSYDEALSVADNVFVQTVANGTFPTAYPMTFQNITFNLGARQKIMFPENVTLENCQVKSGMVAFHHGTADAIGRDATVVACGSDATAYATVSGATANATVNGARAYATKSYAKAEATARGASAHATAPGATANAMVNGAQAHATSHGATANAMVNGAQAHATALGATANAKWPGAQAHATASGAEANATRDGAQAHATASGAEANATTDGAHAHATASGATANATRNGAQAHATASGATANAMGTNAQAHATATGATANATTEGAQARATASGATSNAMEDGATAYAGFGGIANAMVAGALATASHPKSVAIARHELAVVKVDQGKMISYPESRIISDNLDKFCDRNNSNRADAAYAMGMAFCDGKGVTQSDTLATLFLSAAYQLAHRHAAFELGELYSKKRVWFRRDYLEGDDWYSRDTSDAKKVREMAPKYALLFEGLHDNQSALHGIPEDVIKVVGNLLGRL